MCEKAFDRPSTLKKVPPLISLYVHSARSS
jgi:hypothetical protein